jgi:hypothetical protein
LSISVGASSTRLIKSGETEALGVTAVEVLLEVLEACHDSELLVPAAVLVSDGAAEEACMDHAFHDGGWRTLSGEAETGRGSKAGEDDLGINHDCNV